MEQWVTIFLTEILGTGLLLILGNGIMANVFLKGTKENNAGVLAIAIGWGLALTISITIASALGGPGHVNPAVTLAFVVFDWEKVGSSWGLLPLILLGQIIVNLFYFRHIIDTAKSKETKLILAMHTSTPAHKCIISSFTAEFIATLLFVMLIFASTVYKDGWFLKDADFMGPILIGLVGTAVGLSLGGQTGASINPVRDLVPRIIYQLLPIKEKEKAQWLNYSWIPVVAPILAGLATGGMFIIV